MDQRSVAPRIRRGIKLRDMFLEDKVPLSNADFHHEITRNVEDSAIKASGKQQHQGTDSKTVKKEEFVKYMSIVPRYVEKVKNIQEKPLNVGVLDWGRLEKWRRGNRQVTPKHGISPVSSRTSFFSTDGSSPYSVGDRSSSSALQWKHDQEMHSHPDLFLEQNGSQEIKSCSLKGPLSSRSPHTGQFVPRPCQTKAYSCEFNSRSANKVGELSQKFQEQSISTGSNKNVRRSPRANEASRNIPPEIRLGKCEGIESDPKVRSEVERSKTGTRFGEPNLNVSEQDCSNRPKTVVLFLPKDHAETCSSVSLLPICVMSSSDSQSSPKTSNYEKIHGSESSENSQLCSSFSQDCSKESAVSKESCCAHGPGVEVSSRSLQGKASHAKISTCRSVIETRAGMKSQGEVLFSANLEARAALGSAVASRNRSPLRNFGHGMTRIIKSASSRDHSPQRRPVSRDIASKSVVERAAAAAVSLENTLVDSSLATNRARSSPLRRLLDPLFKLKGLHSVHTSQQFKDDLEFSDGPHKGSNKPVHVRGSDSAKVMSRLKSVCRVGADSSHPIVKRGSPRLQALLQVAVKSGLPLFTFAIDSSSDVLAATLKTLGAPGKDSSSWTYTFLNVHEMKRKNGIWSNQGPKKNGPGYVPNVVAQMRVSNQPSPSHSGRKLVDDDDLREFVLLGMDEGQSIQQGKEFLPTEELAAVVVNLPKTVTRDAVQTDEPVDRSSACSQERRGFNDGFPVSCDALRSTVILPGGVHTVPSKAAVSTLTQRWRSGGSCDCGGWDLGCQLRVYSNRKKIERPTHPNNSSRVVDEFKLFSQEGEENEGAVLRMTPFKDWIFSVEFDSSVSPLQTFAICIAVLECSRTSEFWEQSNISQEMTPDISIPVELIQTKAINRAPRLPPVPARYFSYPPLSPVGRA